MCSPGSAALAKSMYGMRRRYDSRDRMKKNSSSTAFRGGARNVPGIRLARCVKAVAMTSTNPAYICPRSCSSSVVYSSLSSSEYKFIVSGGSGNDVTYARQ